MAITYRPNTDRDEDLDVEAVRAIYRAHGGRGIERTYGWTPTVIAILRGDRD
jgi:hypothetical protein